LEAFIEMCRERSEQDGLYAIAYAIMVSANERKRNNEFRLPEDIDDEVSKRIATWLDEKKVESFCLLDAWVECLGREVVDYDRTNAKLLGRAISLLNNLVDVGVRKSSHYGKQRIYYVVRKDAAPAAPADDDDLGI